MCGWVSVIERRSAFIVFVNVGAHLIEDVLLLFSGKSCHFGENNRQFKGVGFFGGLQA